MAYNHEYPYTDPYRANADWLINTVKQLDNKVNNIIEGKLDAFLDEYFNKIMINAIYNEPEREIILKREVVVADGIHVYNAGDDSMSIEG